MEIVYLTDIHDDLKNLRFVLQKTKADLYILSGDLIYKAFATWDKLYHFAELQDSLLAEAKRRTLRLNAHELADRITTGESEADPALQTAAAEYKKLFQQAAFNMKKKYEVFRETVRKYADAPAITIPGNYDMDLQYTALKDLDLHKGFRDVKGFIFAGYGGAPVLTPGIPEMLSVDFREADGQSEPYDFFSSRSSDILVIHNPAYGTLDRLPSYGHCGSRGIRRYAEEKHPALVLSGHVHEDYGLIRIDSTFYLNSSNFGGVDSLHGFEPGGWFAKISLQKDERVYVRKVILCRADRKSLKEIAEIRIDKKLRASESVLDEKEFARIQRFLR